MIFEGEGYGYFDMNRRLASVVGLLDKIQGYAQSPKAARYATLLRRAMSEYVDGSPDDPVAEVVLLVYPALTHNDNWAAWPAGHFRLLRDTLINLAKMPKVSGHAIEKAILRLEHRLNLAAVPYEVGEDALAAIEYSQPNAALMAAAKLHKRRIK